jgi:hypothetical protein
MEPEANYPIMATLCKRDDINKIDRVITKAKCNALGLNEHIQRAILRGSLRYRGMELPTMLSKSTTCRINYFLYHIHINSKVRDKLDASPVYSVGGKNIHAVPDAFP